MFHTKTFETINGKSLDRNLLGSLSVPTYIDFNECTSYEIINRYQDGSVLISDRVNNAFHFITSSGESIREELLSYSRKAYKETVDSLVKNLGEGHVLGKGKFSTVIDISTSDVNLAMKVTSGSSFLSKEHQELKTREKGFEHRMSLVDHLKVRQVIEEANLPFIRQPKLYGFSLFLGAKRDEIVEVIYMEELYAQCFEDVYAALAEEPFDGLDVENKCILELYFNGDSIAFGTCLQRSYSLALHDLEQLGEGKINGRVGDISRHDPGGERNILVAGYDSKFQRFNFILIDVTEFEEKKVKLKQELNKRSIFQSLALVFNRLKSYFLD